MLSIPNILWTSQKVNQNPEAQSPGSLPDITGRIDATCPPTCSVAVLLSRIPLSQGEERVENRMEKNLWVKIKVA